MSARAHRSELADAPRRAFYNLGGPWQRARLFAALGSTRYSHPAEAGIDTMLEALVPGGGGIFVEAGAHDGYTQSNTFYLERHCGWSGVLVEAVPELFRRARRRRRHSQVFGCALVSPEREGTTVAVAFGDLCSNVAGDSGHAARGLGPSRRRSYTVEVPGRTLSAVLEEAGVGRADVLVLDVEGSELDVLAGLDLERHGPAHMLVETNDRAAQQPGVDAALASHYDFVRAASPVDLLYRRRS
jgi:FkbM family methyltransferase